MQCPRCASTDVFVGECYELLYDLADGDTPGELLNAGEAAKGPGDYYFVCTNCWCRWDTDRALLGPVSAVPSPVIREL